MAGVRWKRRMGGWRGWGGEMEGVKEAGME